jgi:hypothetical protein
MRWNKPLPGTRLVFYLASFVGLFRAVEQSVSEAGAPAERIDPTTRAEGQDVNAAGVFLAGVGILLGLWAVVLVLYPLFTHFKYARTGGLDPEKVLVYAPPLPPRPRNVDDMYRKLEVFRAREDSALSSYRWVDRSKGIVSIPIERAMQILAQQGVPPSKPGGAEYYPPSAGSLMTGFENKTRPEPR